MDIMQIYKSEKENKVDTIDSEIAYQQNLADLSNDAMNGTRAMVKAGTKYIPMGAKETPKKYQERLERGIMTETFKETVEFLSGQVFQKSVILSENAPQEFIDWATNVDAQGNDFTRWCINAFQAGVINGTTFALVEHSRIDTRANEVGQTEYFDGSSWQIKTKKSDIENGWRPYLIHIPLQNVVSCWVEEKNGNQEITMFRYKEVIKEPIAGNPFGRETIERIRCYMRGGYFEVWEKREAQEEYALIESGKLSIDFIPLAVFMCGDKITNCTAVPSLEGLAQLNVREWKSQVSYYNLKEYNDKPIYFASGLGATTFEEDERGELKEKAIIIEVGDFVKTDNDQAQLHSVGINSDSMAHSRNDIAKLCEAMGIYGMQIIQPKTGVKTATEIQRESDENNSKLQVWAGNFEDFLDNLLMYLGMWLNNTTTVNAQVNKEFSQPIDKEYILNLYRLGLLSRETVLEISKRIGQLPDNISIEEELQRIDNDMNMLIPRNNPTVPQDNIQSFGENYGNKAQEGNEENETRKIENKK